MLNNTFFRFIFKINVLVFERKRKYYYNYRCNKCKYIIHELFISLASLHRESKSENAYKFYLL